MKYPSMGSDAILAANKALIQYQLNGMKSQSVFVNGVQFSVPIVLPVAPGAVEAERATEQAEQDALTRRIRSG